jgi:ectoine hydroxylase-related dioxygenase (phytanoyl-CoA dioxygenase family)
MAVFHNSKLNESLLKEGYVIISLLNQDDINLLETFYYLPENEGYTNVFTTYACSSFEYKDKVDALLKEVIGKKLKTLFTDEMIPFWGNFMMKIPSENSNMPLHTDWQYVDENQHISLNVWVPFTDTNLENGALHVVPKSHLYCNYPRGMNLPRYYEKNEEDIKKKFGKALYLKKGEAVIYDHRLLHYSFANKSNTNRLAATLVYVPNKAKIALYFRNNTTEKTHAFEIENATSLIQSNFYELPKDYKNKKEVNLPDANDISVFDDLNKHLQKKLSFLNLFKLK